jgi:thiamine monophosphate synthase
VDINQKILLEIKKFRNISESINSRLSAGFYFTDRKKNNNLAKTINNLPKNSAVVFREYDLDFDKRIKLASKIVRICRQNNHKILIGKSFTIARELRADGVHFSDFDKLPIQFFKKNSFPKKFIFSFACHDYKSVLASRKFMTDVVFVSPIFTSTSHLNQATLGIRTLVKINSTAKKNNLAAKIYALGGVNSDNLHRLRKRGIEGFGAIDMFSNQILINNDCKNN